MQPGGVTDRTVDAEHISPHRRLAVVRPTLPAQSRHATKAGNACTAIPSPAMASAKRNE